MAKVSAKTTEAVVKKVTKEKAPLSIVKISESILDKLQTLGLESGLQSDIVWCLGSYKHDQNPVGLVETSTKAIAVLKAELAKKTKGVTAKFISDLEKGLAAL
jgi:hypothetical protein